MAYFRIKEAAEKVGVLPHVLRFWESQFPQLKPTKTSRGQRLYTDEDIESFLKIKHLLYTEGYSIPGAKKFLKEERQATNVGTSSSQRAPAVAEEALHKGLLEDVLKDLKELREFVREIY
ncbi:MAG: MerR family transcriptional regulator [Proteobacteria bacterium]|nr:MerR family transcriptional regulator [Pseudomonadota bacterium]